MSMISPAEKDAIFRASIRSDSGYTSTLECRINIDQWVAIGWATDIGHPDTFAALNMYTAMSEKLLQSRGEGRNGWNNPDCTPEHLSDLLRQAVDKGDPVDVANYCAFLLAKGAQITPEQSV